MELPCTQSLGRAAETDRADWATGPRHSESHDVILRNGVAADSATPQGGPRAQEGKGPPPDDDDDGDDDDDDDDDGEKRALRE